MNSVTDLITDLPDDERVIVTRLRALILECESRLQEKLSYGVPYFSHNRRICFLWPASLIPAGYKPAEPVRTKVTLGLCYGNLLSNDQSLLQKGDRKQVYTIDFTFPAEINDQAIREIILEAVMVDDQFKKSNKKKI
jgi:uncharacterized protein YdhG (YjbR/CyaY superfamily)